MIERIVKFPEQSFFLFGPRLTGKSYLLKNRFQASEMLYIDLLNTRESHAYEQDPALLYRETEAAWKRGIKRVIVDEIQKIPALLDEVHRMIEAFPDIQFVLCGSSARKLKKMHGNLLAGRALTRSLYPLTWQECPDKNLIKLLSFGSLPAIYQQESEGAKEMLRSYVNTYLNEEIKQEALVRQLGVFLKFLSLAGAESGNILNFSNLSRQIGVNYKTIQEYFEILNDTMLGFYLYPFARAVRSALAKHPKFYFFDVGVLRAINKELTMDLLPGTSIYGKYFEHWVIQEIMRYNDYHQKDWRLSFYRTSGGDEIDLLVEKPNHQLVAIEIKSRENILSFDLKSLKKFGLEHPEAQLFCVAQVPRAQVMEGIWIVPWQDIFQYLE